MKHFLKNFLCTVSGAITLATGAHAENGLGKLPLWFEPVQSGETQFTAHARGTELNLTADGAEFILRKPGFAPANVRMTFAGATGSANIFAGEKISGKINYFTGDNPAGWRPNNPAFSRVCVDNIYPGINVVFYGDNQDLEYDFNLAAGARPDGIALHIDGAEKISINSGGELVIQAGGGEIIEHRPQAYQTISGQRRSVAVDYKILDARTVAFSVGHYDHNLPLTIDPVLGYSTYFGGNYGENALAIAVNPADDSIFIAGQIFSTQVTNNVSFATTNAYSTNFNGGTILFGDAFVAHFDSSGTNLLYCTYLGGSKDDIAYSLAVDNAGHAFVTGTTDSTNFPTTNAVSYGSFSGGKISGVYQSQLNEYPLDAFVTELETNGGSFIYSTYLGGSSWDAAYAIAINPAGDAFVTGYTLSSNFPVTAAAVLKHLACTNNFYVNGNAFVSEIAAGGKNLNYSTYLGGTNNDIGSAICYNNGNVFVAGQTFSTNFPWTNGLAICNHLNEYTNTTQIPNASDGFVTAFSMNGTNLDLQYSTFLGSTNDDVATGIAADAAGNAYVVGWTVSTNFPNTTNGAQLYSFVRTNSAFGAATNAFLTKILWNGPNTNVTIGYSQIFGGNGMDIANGVALDSSGNIFVVGTETSATNYNAIGTGIFGSLRATNSGSSDAFVTVFKSDLSSLIYSACLGGNKTDLGNAIAVDNEGNAIIAGTTSSTNFPVLGTWSTNLTALHQKMDGTNDAFITRIVTGSSPALLAASSGTNVLVYWPAIADVTPLNLSLETVSNLLMTVKIVTTTNNVKTTNYVTTGTTNWILVTNPAPVFTNGNYIYNFNPTNPMRFFRFHQF